MKCYFCNNHSSTSCERIHDNVANIVFMVSICILQISFETQYVYV